MKKLVVLGAGESGVGAAMLARRNDYAVFVSDSGSIDQAKKQEFTALGIDFEERGHSANNILNATLIIKSPGISPANEIVKKAALAGVPVIDELEFAFGYSKGKVIAITGTNGKTTTSLLTYHLMKEAGIDVGLAGNVGKSWARQLVDVDHEFWVIECSSFQIDGMRAVKPHIAMLCNITPDHLDRYDYKIEEYVKSKFGIFKNMGAEDHAILFAEDAWTSKGLAQYELKASKTWVSTGKIQETGAWVSGDTLSYTVTEQDVEIPLSSLTLKGTHNYLNALFAGSAALLAGLSKNELMNGFSTFKNAPHRMEEIRKIDGVTYINDSKGTNVESTAYALSSCEPSVIWIAGGVDKGNNYEMLIPIVKDRVSTLICLGKDNSKLKKAFTPVIGDIRETVLIGEAVAWSQVQGKPGDVVLLSPACASFDLFKNYEDRGQQFRAAVENLKTKAIS